MIDKIKVMTVVGTRPEIIRLSRVIPVLDEVTNHTLVHTGQNYDWELNGIFFEDLGVKPPKHYLEAAGKNAAETIGNVIIRTDAVLEAEQPDAVLILGDTNSCLAAIPAKRRKIPIFHMEAGNRCFDMRVPEEVNRRIVDHTSDINLCYSEHARRNLLAEGLPTDLVMKTGSPMKEIIDYHSATIAASDVHQRLDLTPAAYFTVSIHREENVDNPAHLDAIVIAINALAEQYNFPVVFSVHPRTRKRLAQRETSLHKLVRALPPLGFFDYMALQKSAFCTISDSGTITEESSILGFPAITVREAHERPEGMDEGAIVMTGLRPGRIIEAVELTRAQFAHVGPCRLPLDYDVSQVSWKVAKIILSYTDYVNRRVWNRHALPASSQL
ncbi:non-hydrolyzing UDP-N-acetylglucosamine 2-epimerase [Lyngbya confervoides]|uniref:UDP-N-acetylglucosamine 2-epimerase (Non-hydrolyzing) n=1 Tax=Lyngbya confervoides BDU141951 TaxID=1574623 RepID=A0ABD4T3W0_9CYAN|nr:UDP-N-acetylglucosamine 2-epimerase (non-hydrolyzing) [Lyngbya confervoides]MCM1983005.1 UDP-N-acetylglucosamine 2-epimerase (non-hydrolyzing) [Lyngbya confervoides BDU141951]